jgi:hypothetical protein
VPLARWSAQTVGPTADYKIDPEYTSTSPDGTTAFEQYAKVGADGSYVWQFWARHLHKARASWCNAVKSGKSWIFIIKHTVHVEARMQTGWRKIELPETTRPST